MKKMKSNLRTLLKNFMSLRTRVSELLLVGKQEKLVFTEK